MPHLISRLRPFPPATLIILLAAAVRVAFALAISNTYDYDEFVILQLARNIAWGEVPYRDFMFFHPPGVLILYRAIEPLTQLWWPAGRIVPILLDSITASFVYLIARQLYGARAAAFAGILYVFSPIALVSSSRVGQDPLITFFGIAGLWLLLRYQNPGGALAAGACLALALWTKYPAALFLPVYAIAAPRRFLWVLCGLAAGIIALFGPFLGSFHQLYQQTVLFQRGRWSMSLTLRLETVALFWLAVNPLALPGVFFRPRRPWLILAFFAGIIFLANSQVYYHYYVLIAPFGALLSAPVAAALFKNGAPLFATGTAVAAAWAALLNLGGSSPLLVTAAHLSDIRPTITAIDRMSQPGDRILADRFEYAYLARKRPLANYFWNIGVLVDARYLEQRVPNSRLVVLSYGASSGYPGGFLRYLNRSYASVRTPANTIWTIPARG